MAFAERLADCRGRVEAALEHWLPASDTEPGHLHEAIRYSVLGNGKRIRPLLVYASGETLQAPIAALDGCACAVEMLHAYSLIHDDLPAMDDDDLRRGRPTCHRAYDEATAILAGDALQAMAFQVLSEDPAIAVAAEQRVKMINTLAIASGSCGMAGGQAIDINSVGERLSLTQLQRMHSYKTGALIKASVELGALSCATITDTQFAHISQYAECIGLAFQIHDDVLDIESDTETLGKPQGADQAMNKPTYPNLLGLDGAKKAARDLLSEALDALADFNEDAEPLRWMAKYIVERNR